MDGITRTWRGPLRRGEVIEIDFGDGHSATIELTGMIDYLSRPPPHLKIAADGKMKACKKGFEPQ